MSTLRFTDIRVMRQQQALLDGISFDVKPGQCVVLLGSNGAGKTTLLRSTLGLIPTASGHITLGESVDPRTLKPEARARHIAYLPQMRSLAWPISVSAAVALGRYAYTEQRSAYHKSHQQAIERALTSCGLTALAERSTDTLSGGELARVHIARAFATEAPLLLADEPIDALDPLHQWQVMTLIKHYTNRGNSALIALHDISLAARFADHVILLKKGTIIAQGPPSSTLTQETLKQTYGVNTILGEAQGYQSITVTGTALPPE